MLLELIEKLEESTALLSEVAEYVKNCHHDLGKFAAQAFELNHRELVALQVKKQGALLHALATGLIAKYGVSGYDPDVIVLNLL